MYLNYFFICLTISFTVIEAFFLLEDKEPFFFCFKICPLYCSKRRRRDEGSSLIYTDDLPPFIYDHEHDHEYDLSPYYFCKPHPTTTSTTTQKTTTEEPTFICQLCAKKCPKKSK